MSSLTSVRPIQKAGLILNQKCVVSTAEIDFLGHHIGLCRVKPWRQKVKDLLNYNRPTNRKELHGFLGLAGYYQKYLHHFTSITSCLSDLLMKNIHFDWTPLWEQIFLNIKSRLASKPVLILPDYTKPFILVVDASDTGIGASLLQETDGCEAMNAWTSVLAGFRQLVQPTRHAFSRTFINSSYGKWTTGGSHVVEFIRAWRTVASQYSRRELLALWFTEQYNTDRSTLATIAELELLRYRGTRASRRVQAARVNQRTPEVTCVDSQRIEVVTTAIHKDMQSSPCWPEITCSCLFEATWAGQINLGRYY